MTRDETGGITVLTVGFFVIVGLLVVVVVDASAVFLARRDLMNSADRVALHAADGLDLERVYAQGIDDEVVLDASDAQRLVGDVAGPHVRIRLRVDTDQVWVDLERDIDLPISPPGFTASTTITAEAVGQLRLSE